VTTPLAHQVEEHGLPLPRLAAGSSFESAAPRIRLDAAPQPAVAPAAARFRTDVADLSGGAATDEEPPADHEASPHAGPPEDAEERAHSPAGAIPSFGLDRHRHVVAERNWNAQLLCDRAGKRKR